MNSSAAPLTSNYERDTVPQPPGPRHRASEGPTFYPLPREQMGVDFVLRKELERSTKNGTYSWRRLLSTSHFALRRTNPIEPCKVVRQQMEITWRSKCAMERLSNVVSAWHLPPWWSCRSTGSILETSRMQQSWTTSRWLTSCHSECVFRRQIPQWQPLRLRRLVC